MLNGGHFVEALGRLGYPGASSLKASDFDWLFSDTPENRQFLRFFCRTLNHSNVLTVEEVRGFQELKKSGKPLLDEAALSDVLKTIGKPDGSNANVSGSGSSSSFLEESVDVEDLEAELKALRKEKALKQQRFSRLHAAAITRADADLRLAAELESSAERLRDAGASVAAANAGGNASLRDLTDAVGDLASRLSKQPEAGGKADGSKRPPALLSELSLDPYLHREELNTRALTAFTQKYFFQALSRKHKKEVEEVEEEEEEEEEEEGWEEVEEGKEEEQGEDELQECKIKMTRLQRSYIIAQHQLMLATAEEKGLEAGLRWLSGHSSHTESSTSSSCSLAGPEVEPVEDLQTVKAELEALMHREVPEALRESAGLLKIPVVSGVLALQQAKLKHLSSVQDQVQHHLLRQKASFDVMHLAQEVELRRWKKCQERLEEMKSRLRKQGEAATLREAALANPELAVNPASNIFISSKDTAFSRLLQMLAHDKDNSQSQPFQTYERLEQAARHLAGRLRTGRDGLAGVCREQLYTAARLSGDLEALHRSTYTELQQLVLGPQELTSKLVETEDQLSSLHNIMQEIIGDVKAKRSQLERNALLRRERELYVYFHLNVRLLQKTVENLEKAKKRPEEEKSKTTSNADQDE